MVFNHLSLRTHTHSHNPLSLSCLLALFRFHSHSTFVANINDDDIYSSFPNLFIYMLTLIAVDERFKPISQKICHIRFAMTPCRIAAE